MLLSYRKAVEDIGMANACDQEYHIAGAVLGGLGRGRR